MKTLKLSACFLLLTTLLMAGCDKEDDDSNNNNNNNNNSTAPTENTLTATVDGQAWTLDATTFQALYAGVAQSLTISGSAADGSAFTVQLNLWDGSTGTFNTAITTTNFVGLTYDDGTSETYSAPTNINGNASNQTSGTIAISYYDGTKVKGTFSFTGGQDNSSNTVSITNGSFSAIAIQQL